MTKLKNKDPTSKDFQSLDALLLLKTSSSHPINGEEISSSHGDKKFASLDKPPTKNARKNLFSSPNKPYFHQSASDRLSGGFDNVAFDLESLEEGKPGSRKPLISVHVRTLSPEEYVLSTLNKQPLTSQFVQNTVLSLDCNNAINSSINRSGSSLPHIEPNAQSLCGHPRSDPLNGDHSPHSIFFSDRTSSAICKLAPHSMPTHAPCPSNQCPGATLLQDCNKQFHSLPPSLSLIAQFGEPLKRDEGSGDSPDKSENNFSDNNNSCDDDEATLSAQMKPKREFNAATKIRLKQINNSGNADDNEKADASQCNNSVLFNAKLNERRLKERESNNNKNSLFNSTTSNARKKMDAKKTECGSLELLLERADTKQQVLSSRETMVQIGGVSGLSPPNIQSMHVSSPSKTAIKNANIRTNNGNVSQVSVINNLSVNNRVSNVVISSGGVCVAPTSVPTVSALSKVSSVRIVPSPVTTPTPSVIGGGSDTSSISSQTRTRPLSIVRQNKINLRNATIPPRYPNVALPSSVHQVQAARHQQSLEPHQSNPRREGDPHQAETSLTAPFLSLPPAPGGETDRRGGGPRIQPKCAPVPSSATSNLSNQQSVSNISRPPSNRGPQSTVVTTSVVNVNANSGGSQSQNSTTTITTSPSTTNHSNATTGHNNATTNHSNGNTSQSNNNNVESQLQTNTAGNSATNESDPINGSQSNSGAQSGLIEGPRRQGRERRRERRERRRERRALRNSGVPAPVPPQLLGQTDVNLDPQPPMPIHPPHLPDLLNSHVPPPYSTLPNGPRSLGCLIGHPHNMGHPPPMSLQMPPGPPPPPPGPPMGSMGPFPPPGPINHGPQLRPPPPDNPWHFFGSRRSRGSPRCAPYISDEEAKSCCGLLVTQAVSIRWFIIMIAFVGLCCTVVGTVLGAVKTNSSEYVTITLLMIGVGIVLITVSGVAWHLTSRDAPCRVMLGLAPSGRGETRNRFMARMAPTFGRPHHPYAAMMYPEFQYRPPPPSYQASMQEYRLRLLLLDRQGAHHGPPLPNGPSPPPIYRHPSYNGRMLVTGTLGQESEYSRPPSYRSMEGSVLHHPDAHPSIHPGGGTLPHTHSRDPSCLSFLSHDSLYSTTTPGSMEGSTTRRGRSNANKISIVGSADVYEPNKYSVVESIENPSTSHKKGGSVVKDDNTVTIVQTTDCSHVIGSESVIVTVSGSESLNCQLQQQRRQSNTEISVLAHL